ncbi:dTDP-3-amino-3,4,6-trideoxy-alpha-D-glucose transaminase [Paenibacillus sp. CECT 9249]|uniref:DegT/DnrJ/EryC1/StrS family aminotransferase n=1 Tax=Paenibacillus sp. CECT 9249 TaxID=2845385 RepID=UPI001E53FD5E|nr:DegT/DnrJ/EryC1/StrS family aminotransferase [Paenibacillus sp. CECT 9249]CAH0119660.1 dTDP-3-amino-3,4,6-trideoxy-alpha-D-glucose transaminase [Paenibacillus sp. CECT 9249]
MRILFSAPQYEYEMIREQWLEAVAKIARQGVFVGGPPVSEFEAAFAAYLQAEGTVGVGNGTDAIYLALQALGVGPDDEVITAANTFVATVGAIHHTGARPVLVDCNEHYLIDLERVKECVTSRTKAIIPVHLYGKMADLKAIAPWAAERGIALIEDCAQAAGASLDGIAAGRWGVMGCFSFYPDKNLGALGDGGAVVSSSFEMIAKLRKLRNHGGEVRYQHEICGYNSRLDPIQASALQLKLRYLDDWNNRRREIARHYRFYLGAVEFLTLPEFADDNSHVFHLYVVRVKYGLRDALKKHLQKKGVLTAVQYPVPVHRLPAYAHLGYKAGDFPHAELYAGEILSLPMHVAMTENEVRFIASEIRTFYESCQTVGR